MKLVHLSQSVNTGEALAGDLQRLARWFEWVVKRGKIDWVPTAPWALWFSVCTADDLKKLKHKVRGARDEVIGRCDELWLVGEKVDQEMLGDVKRAREKRIFVRDLTRLGSAEPPDASVVVVINRLVTGR